MYLCTFIYYSNTIFRKFNATQKLKSPQGVWTLGLGTITLTGGTFLPNKLLIFLCLFAVIFIQFLYITFIKIHFLITSSNFFRWFVNRVRKYEKICFGEILKKIAIITFLNVKKCYIFFYVSEGNIHHMTK